jgi:tRNA pseudouridine13 synthase
MFIHSVQSYIFNVTLTKLLEAGKTLPDTLPLVGYNTNLESEVGKIIKEIMEAEGIDCELFRLKHMPELSEAGEERNTKLTVKNFKILHIEEKELTIRFILDKGSYATVLLKALLGAYYE